MAPTRVTLLTVGDPGRVTGGYLFHRRLADRAPDYGAVHVWLAATYARLGRMGDARAAAARVLELDPGFTIERVAKTTIAFRQADDAEHCFEGLRRAGLPVR